MRGPDSGGPLHVIGKIAPGTCSAGGHAQNPGLSLEALLEPWFRNLLAVWPCMFTMSMGLMAVIPMLPLYIEERFELADPYLVRTWTGIIYGAGPFTAAVFGPLWGALGDRVGRKPMVIRATGAIAVVMALMPLAPTPATLAALRVLQGVFAGYVAPAMALVSAEVPRERQGRVISYLQVALALGLFLGPPLGAEIAAWTGRASVFWFTSLLAALAFLPVALLARDRPGRPHAGPAPGLIHDLVVSSRHLLQNRLFAGLLVVLFLVRCGQHMAEPYVALFVRDLGPLPIILKGARDLEHAVDRTTALAFVILAVGQVLCTPVWGRLADRVGPLLCLSVVSLCLSGILWGMSRVTTVQEFLALRCAAAVFMAATMTLAYAAASKRVVASRRSLAFAMVQSCIQLGLSLGPFAGGVVAGVAGAADRGPDLRILFTLGAVCLLVAGLVMLVLRRIPAGRLPAPSPAIPDERT